MNASHGFDRQYMEASRRSTKPSASQPVRQAAEGLDHRFLRSQLSMDAKQEAKLERQIEKVKRGLAALGDPRPGSLSTQYNVCGSPGCRRKATPPENKCPGSSRSGCIGAERRALSHHSREHQRYPVRYEPTRTGRCCDCPTNYLGATADCNPRSLTRFEGVLWNDPAFRRFKKRELRTRTDARCDQ